VLEILRFDVRHLGIVTYRNEERVAHGAALNSRGPFRVCSCSRRVAMRGILIARSRYT
jgi:hypothetical protein